MRRVTPPKRILPISPVAVNSLIFFFSDLYGFLCRKKREQVQC